MKYFLLSLSPLSLPLIQGEQLSVSSERMCTDTGQPLTDLSLLRKTVVRYTDWLDMTVLR